MPTTARTLPAASCTGKATAAPAPTAFAPGLTAPVWSSFKLHVESFRAIFGHRDPGHALADGDLFAVAA